MAVSSANITGKSSFSTARGVLSQLDGKIPLILDGGVTAGMKVVTDGADRLKNGALVSVTETRQGSASSAGQGAAASASAGVFGASGAKQQPGPAGAGQGGKQGGSGSQKQGDKQ